MLQDWVFNLKGKEVVFTGKIDGYDRKHDLTTLAERLESMVNTDVRKTYGRSGPSVKFGEMVRAVRVGGV